MMIMVAYYASKYLKPGQNDPPVVNFNVIAFYCEATLNSIQLSVSCEFFIFCLSFFC
jgi:hypothetical protein